MTNTVFRYGDNNEELDTQYKYFGLLLTETLGYKATASMIADSEEYLQKAITCMETYCGTWKLIVNESKTMLIIFGKSKVKTNFKFIYNEVELELVEHFKYLGTDH